MTSQTSAAAQATMDDDDDFDSVAVTHKLCGGVFFIDATGDVPDVIVCPQCEVDTPYDRQSAFMTWGDFVDLVHVKNPNVSPVHPQPTAAKTTALRAAGSPEENDNCWMLVPWDANAREDMRTDPRLVLGFDPVSLTIYLDADADDRNEGLWNALGFKTKAI